jgi:hypothetical protein
MLTMSSVILNTWAGLEMTFTPEIMAPTLKKDYPEVEKVTRVSWTRNLSSDAAKIWS